MLKTNVPVPVSSVTAVIKLAEDGVARKASRFAFKSLIWLKVTEVAVGATAAQELPVYTFRASEVVLK